VKSELSNTSVAFKVYYFAFILAGFALFSYLMRDFPLERFREILLFITLIVVADTAQITLPRGGASIYASSPIDLAGIVLLGPSAMALVEAVASLFSEVVVQRRSAFKVAFNVPLLILTVGIAGIVYHAFPGEWRGLDSPRFLVPLTVSGLTYYAVNTVSISFIIRRRAPTTSGGRITCGRSSTSSRSCRWAR